MVAWGSGTDTKNIKSRLVLFFIHWQWFAEIPNLSWQMNLVVSFILSSSMIELSHRLQLLVLITKKNTRLYSLSFKVDFDLFSKCYFFQKYHRPLICMKSQDYIFPVLNS